MNQFDLVSDLHVDINGYDGLFFNWTPESDTLVIAGDCANDAELSCEVITEAKRYYDYVIFTDGNHEHYRPRKRSVNDNRKILNSVTGDGITYLDSDMIIIGGTLLVGANGWYDFNSYDKCPPQHQKGFWKSDMNDSRVIRFNDMPEEMAYQQYRYINDIVVKAQDDPTIDTIVVVTHTIPMKELAVPDHHQWAYLNGSYVNSYMRDIMDNDHGKLKVWVYGHTHNHNDKVIDGVRFVNNARGYIQAKENSFSGSLYININEDLSYGDIFVDKSDQ